MAERQVTLRFRNYRVPGHLYAGHKVSGDRNRMAIFLTAGEPIRIEGADNVSAAILEIQRALEPDMGPGWRDVGD